RPQAPPLQFLEPESPPKRKASPSTDLRQRWRAPSRRYGISRYQWLRYERSPHWEILERPRILPYSSRDSSVLPLWLTSAAPLQRDHVAVLCALAECSLHQDRGETPERVLRRPVSERRWETDLG